MIVYATTDEKLSSSIKAAGFLHPSRVTLEDADLIKSPMILMPSNDEPDMVSLINRRTNFLLFASLYADITNNFSVLFITDSIL